MRLSLILTLAFGSMMVVAIPAEIPQQEAALEQRAGGRKPAVSIPGPKFKLICQAPAVDKTCARDCSYEDLPEGSSQPDCGTPTCYDKAKDLRTLRNLPESRRSSQQVDFK